jgi:hypothetical protein
LVFTRTLTVGASKGATILVADVPDSNPLLDGSSATLSSKGADGQPRSFKAQLSGAPGGAKFDVQKERPPDPAPSSDRHQRDL